MIDFDQGKAIAAARAIIDELCIEAPQHIDLLAIAAHRGVFVKEGELNSAEGRLTVLGARGLITIRSDIREEGKKRFVIGHEIGHFELHRALVPTMSCRESDFNEWTRNKPLEMEANYFSSELLMPQNIFKAMTKGKKLSKTLLSSVAAEFKTSLTATAIRYLHFNQEYAIVMSRDAKVKWFVKGEDFPYHLSILGKLHPETLAYDFFQEGKDLPDDWWPVNAIGWVDSSRVVGKEIMEMIIPFPRYGEVLSLLRVDED